MREFTSMTPSETFFFLLAVLVVVMFAVLVPKKDQPGLHVSVDNNEYRCVQVLQDATDHTLAVCHTSAECNAVCDKARGAK